MSSNERQIAGKLYLQITPFTLQSFNLLLKVSTTNLALHPFNIVGLTMDSSKNLNKCSRTRDKFWITNWVPPSLPTMNLGFWCVMPVTLQPPGAYTRQVDLCRLGQQSNLATTKTLHDTRLWHTPWYSKICFLGKSHWVLEKIFCPNKTANYAVCTNRTFFQLTNTPAGYITVQVYEACLEEGDDATALGASS